MSWSSFLSSIANFFSKKQPEPIAPPVVYPLGNGGETPVIPIEKTKVPTRDEMLSVVIGMIDGTIITRVGAYKHIRESDGKNRSKAIDAIILANGGDLGDPYCQYGQEEILSELCRYYGVDRGLVKIPVGGSTQDVFDDTYLKYKRVSPVPVCWITWRSGTTWHGHVGMDLSEIQNGVIKTFEFNTSSGNELVRDGDGAYYRERSPKGQGSLVVRGHIDVYQAMLDAMLLSGKFTN